MQSTQNVALDAPEPPAHARKHTGGPATLVVIRISYTRDAATSAVNQMPRAHLHADTHPSNPAPPSRARVSGNHRSSRLEFPSRRAGAWWDCVFVPSPAATQIHSGRVGVSRANVPAVLLRSSPSPRPPCRIIASRKDHRPTRTCRAPWSRQREAGGGRREAEQYVRSHPSIHPSVYPHE
ncbi:hypothetical protein C8R45DRAFT_316725 [Mycena sanguinolenta]|nr:hypothetical protein C8R45DRAFT_316725 [Mycena sanguinolenta]